jgi:hypothetical protein
MYNTHRYGRWTGRLMLNNLPGIQRKNKMLIRIPNEKNKFLVAGKKGKFPEIVHFVF